jgi:uncharacterized protein YfdQ (DUF2303 family)
MDLNEQTIGELIRLGASQADIRTTGKGTPFLVVPDGYRVEGLEKLLSIPIRKRGRVVATTSASFVDYLQKHSQPDASTIYADTDSEMNRCRLIAMIDDHGESIPGWQEHSCLFEPKLSVEWKRWTSNDKKAMEQSAFASFLEDNLPDIASSPGFPTGTEVLQMALGFEATAEKKFRSKINLQSGGVQFEYIEDETKDTRTKMIVFERFTIGIPVFDASENAYAIEARLKYRDKSGVVTFWYELIRPDRVFNGAVSNELASIKEGTGLQIIDGRYN